MLAEGTAYYTRSSGGESEAGSIWTVAMFFVILLFIVNIVLIFKWFTDVYARIGLLLFNVLSPILTLILILIIRPRVG